MKRSERSMQVWQILIAAAHSRSSYTYGQVAAILGMGGAGVMAQFLGPIMHYCSANGLPPLTVLVVNQETGIPGDGLSTLEEVNKDREAVFNHDWFGMYPVQITNFEPYFTLGFRFCSSHFQYHPYLPTWFVSPHRMRLRHAWLKALPCEPISMSLFRHHCVV